MWEPPTIGNPNMLNLLAFLGTFCVIIGSLYGLYKKIQTFFLKRFIEMDARFEKMEARFEMLDNRIFQLSMGKSLKQIMQEERLLREEENE